MLTIRTATTADIPELKLLFKNTVLEINRKDYTAEEVEDWASCGNNDTRWHQQLLEQHYIVAENQQHKIVGFASVNNIGYMDMLFVHKDFQGEGVATLLYQVIEKYALEKGAKQLTSEVSITAKPFFEKQGFVVDQRQERQANKLKLVNYKMSKQIG